MTRTSTNSPTNAIRSSATRTARWNTRSRSGRFGRRSRVSRLSRPYAEEPTSSCRAFARSNGSPPSAAEPVATYVHSSLTHRVRRIAGGTSDVGSWCRTKVDRQSRDRHHGCLRVSEPRASGPSRAGDEHLSVQGDRSHAASLLGRARLSHPRSSRARDLHRTQRRVHGGRGGTRVQLHLRGSAGIRRQPRAVGHLSRTG